MTEEYIIKYRRKCTRCGEKHLYESKEGFVQCRECGSFSVKDGVREEHPKSYRANTNTSTED